MQKLICLILCLVSSSVSAQSDRYLYVGDWVGTGWGWEVRFEQTYGEFTNQFSVRGRNVGAGLAATNKKTIMSLLVQHAMAFNFFIDSNDNVSGQATITYNLIPNLCGLASLTKDVNQMVGALDKLDMIFGWSTEVGKQAVTRFNREFHEQEAELASTLNAWHAASTTAQTGRRASQPLTDLEARQNLVSWMQQSGNNDVVNLARSIMMKRCGDKRFKLLGGLECGEIPMDVDVSSGSEFATQLVLDPIYEVLGDKFQDKLKSLSLESQKDDKICEFGAGKTAAAGTSVGPRTWNELVQEMAPAIAKGLLFDAATGGVPVGLMLSIPGVTQIQYWYKGLSDGPQERRFAIKGKLLRMADGPKLELEVDGDIPDPQLNIEWMVNYKTDKASFPVWSPFLSAPGQLKPSGTLRVYERRSDPITRTFTDAATGKQQTVVIPRETTHARDIEMQVPFVTFREEGEHRNSVRPWKGYEYVWQAHRITSLTK